MDKITIELHIKIAETEIKLNKTLDLTLPIEHFPKDLIDKLSQVLNLIILTSNRQPGKELSFPLILTSDNLAILDNTKFNLTSNGGRVQQSFHHLSSSYINVHLNNISAITPRQYPPPEIPPIDFNL